MAAKMNLADTEQLPIGGERDAAPAPTSIDGLSASNLSLTYGRGPSGVRALQDVSFEVPHGEFLAILGPSGCGKSTLLKMMAGLLQPSGGELRSGVGSRKAARGGRSMMFQIPALLDWLTIERNVSLPLEVGGIRRRDAVREANEMLEMVGLRSFSKRRPYELSGGMQQRVALARAWISKPDLLLLDEPFGALDALTRDELCLELQRMWLTRPMTVVLVTHSVAEAIMLADRVLVMTPAPGRIIADVTIPVGRPRSVADRGGQVAVDLQESLLRTLGAAAATAARSALA